MSEKPKICLAWATKKRHIAVDGIVLCKVEHKTDGYSVKNHQYNTLSLSGLPTYDKTTDDQSHSHGDGFIDFLPLSEQKVKIDTSSICAKCLKKYETFLKRYKNLKDYSSCPFCKYGLVFLHEEDSKVICEGREINFNTLFYKCDICHTEFTTTEVDGQNLKRIKEANEMDKGGLILLKKIEEIPDEVKRQMYYLRFMGEYFSTNGHKDENGLLSYSLLSKSEQKYKDYIISSKILDEDNNKLEEIYYKEKIEFYDKDKQQKQHIDLFEEFWNNESNNNEWENLKLNK